MSPSTQITWRGMEPSAALEARVRELAQGLEKFSPHIVHCRVVIELPHKHGRQGHIYGVRIQITAPGAHLIAQRAHRERHTHEDPYVAVRDAFRAVQRQLEDYERENRGDVKRHVTKPTQANAQSGEQAPPETTIHPGYAV